MQLIINKFTRENIYQIFVITLSTHRVGCSEREVKGVEPNCAYRLRLKIRNLQSLLHRTAVQAVRHNQWNLFAAQNLLHQSIDDRSETESTGPPFVYKLKSCCTRVSTKNLCRSAHVLYRSPRSRTNQSPSQYIFETAFHPWLQPK